MRVRLREFKSPGPYMGYALTSTDKVILVWTFIAASISGPEIDRNLLIALSFLSNPNFLLLIPSSFTIKMQTSEQNPP